MMAVKLFEAVFSLDGKLATQNFAPGLRVYGERLHKIDGVEYREWDPYRSKLGGAVRKGLKEMAIKPGSNVLYLGASTGTTPSHVSDMIGKDGTAFCVEISPTSMNRLLALAEKRENLVPILGDARQPQEYSDVGEVDVIYQDVAQPDQADILIKNSNLYLKNGGIAMFCVKSQSIDVLKKPEDVFVEVKALLEPYFEVVQEMALEPYDKNHLFLVLKKK